jgi:cytochrome c
MLSLRRETAAFGCALALMAAACAPAATPPATTAPPKPTTPPAAAAPTATTAAAAAKPTEAPKPAAAAPTATTAAPAAKPTEPPKPQVDVAAASALITQKGCGGCHIVPGVAGATGTVGPDLTGVGARTTLAGGAVPHRNVDDLKAWIMNPPALKPGTQMPPLGLSDAEAMTIAAFLETLR